MFTGRVVRQTNRLFVLRMIVKLAYTNILKQLVTSGSVNIAVATSTSSRWLFPDIHIAFGDYMLINFSARHQRQQKHSTEK